MAHRGVRPMTRRGRTISKPSPTVRSSGTLASKNISGRCLCPGGDSWAFVNPLFFYSKNVGNVGKNPKPRLNILDFFCGGFWPIIRDLSAVSRKHAFTTHRDPLRPCQINFAYI